MVVQGIFWMDISLMAIMPEHPSKYAHHAKDYGES